MTSDVLVGRVFEATLGALELMSIHLGWRLGLYAALAEDPLTAAELARRAGIDARYATEWLEQQAVAGFLDVVDDSGGADGRRFVLPPPHAEVLADPDSAFHVAPFAPMIVGIAGALPEVIGAYRSGSGVAYARYGADFRDGQGAINRPGFVHELRDWLAASPEIHERLTGGTARVADVGCGQGYSTVALAAAYPNARIDGFDVDDASVLDAKRAAVDAGLDERVSFSVRDAGELSTSGPYDLVCIFEALHDMARPVEALTGARHALTPGGSVFVADERVAEAFTAPGDEVERMMYGWSVLHCLPASRAEHPSAALGTVLRRSTVEQLAEAAGFSAVEVLGVDHDFFRFYRLVP